MGVCRKHNGFTWFLVNTISYGDIPIVVVICELYDKGNNFTSVDHSVYRVSFPLLMHLRHSCNERFIPSTNLFDHGRIQLDTKFPFHGAYGRLTYDLLDKNWIPHIGKTNPSNCKADTKNKETKKYCFLIKKYNLKKYNLHATLKTTQYFMKA